MKKPNLTKTALLYDAKFLKLYEADYDNGARYVVTGRRVEEDLLLKKSEKEIKKEYPDAVTCIVVVKMPRKAPKLLLQYEYRYPAGTFLLSPPAGLIDQSDREGLSREDAVRLAAAREIKEETGLLLGVKDELEILSPFLFSSPGMTDESNALALAVVSVPDESVFTSKGSEGTEIIGDFRLLNKKDAAKLLRDGVDSRGIPFSFQTWAALCYFVSRDWE
jgi:ADP-ribose pyrophosphatase